MVLPLCAFVALGNTHNNQHLHPLSWSCVPIKMKLPTPPQSRWISRPSMHEQQHHHHRGLRFGNCERVRVQRQLSTMELAGVSSLRIHDNAGSLFPSDDSDYEEDNNQIVFSGSRVDGCGDEDGSNDTPIIAFESNLLVLRPTTNDIHNRDDNNNCANSALLGDGKLLPSPLTQASETNLWNDLLAAVVGYNSIDPIDFIADWCSDRFAEQSSSSSSTIAAVQPLSSSTVVLSTSSNNVLVESYPPGSALDVLSRASSSPYTPLSYQIRTIIRVGLPSLLCAMLATISYPHLVNALIHLDNNALYTDQVYTVLSNDLSQYVQNILTTSALLFGMLVGQTYFFMYLQQESVFYALFAEVTEAKSLLEQISLLAYGRPNLYVSLLSRMEDYIQKDLKLLSVRDPISATSGLMPKDDPLESLLYATSVGLPGSLYGTVKSLREARAARCGALQRKLPMLHIYCLRLLGCIVLCTFPVCGSGSVALAQNVVVLQGYMFGVLAFSLTLILGVVEELRNSHSCSSSRGGGGGGDRIEDSNGTGGYRNENVGGFESHRKKMGAYSVDGILGVMVSGLEMELNERLEGKFRGVGLSPSLPTRFFGMGMDIEDNNDNGMDTRYRFKSEPMVVGEEQERRKENSSNESSLTVRSSRRKEVKEWFRRTVLRR